MGFARSSYRRGKASWSYGKSICLALIPLHSVLSHAPAVWLPRTASASTPPEPRMPVTPGCARRRAGAPTAAAASSAAEASQELAATLAAQPPVRASGPAHTTRSYLGPE